MGAGGNSNDHKNSIILSMFIMALQHYLGGDYYGT